MERKLILTALDLTQKNYPCFKSGITVLRKYISRREYASFSEATLTGVLKGQTFNPQYTYELIEHVALEVDILELG